MSDKMLTHRKSRFVVNPSQSSVKTSVNKVNWSHRLSVHTCPSFYWIVPPPSSRLSLNSFFFSPLQFMLRINSGNSILSCRKLPQNTGLFAPEWHCELPCSHYFCLPAHMITLFSPIHFIPLCSAFSVNFFSPKATVWLMLGLFRSPCFHPNCLTPTGTLRGVRLCSLLWAHTSAPHAPHFTQFILFLMPLRRRSFLRPPIRNNISQERLEGSFKTFGTSAHIKAKIDWLEYGGQRSLRRHKICFCP